MIVVAAEDIQNLPYCVRIFYIFGQIISNFGTLPLGKKWTIYTYICIDIRTYYCINGNRVVFYEIFLVHPVRIYEQYYVNLTSYVGYQNYLDGQKL